MNPAENYTIRYLETDDVDQYNALLRYTFQVTEEELTATGWKDDEIKQSKFPVLERADVLGCFDGKNLVSQFAVYPLKTRRAGSSLPPMSSGWTSTRGLSLAMDGSTSSICAPRMASWPLRRSSV